MTTDPTRCPGGDHEKPLRNVCCDECWKRIPVRLDGLPHPWRSDLQTCRSIRHWRSVEEILEVVRAWLRAHPVEAATQA